MKTVFNLLHQKKHLSQSQAKQFLTDVLSGKVPSEDILNFIKAYEKKGPTAHELVGFIAAMKACSLPINSTISPLIDICGTGGSKKNRFNISTCTTFVLAAAGIPVAKHGNYGSSKPNGSFNFLEEMHVNFQLQTDETIELLEKTNCCFLFARKYHPGMRNVATARKEYKERTIFNLLGPLCNPLNITHQVIGISSKEHIDILIKTVQLLNRKRVIFCLGGDNKDEVSLVGQTHIFDVTKTDVKEYKFDFSKEIEANIIDYKCGDSNYNAMIFIKLLLDKDWNHSIIKHICINSAFAMLCVNHVSSIKEGFNLAYDLFKKEAVTKKINEYKLQVAQFETKSLSI
tara:strand:- start:199 stop:1230 length:1032 start_codon:yes stop_codon:yes gene_type:complete